MLNRKLTNYMFYGILIAIATIVFAIRTVTLGAINTRIEDLEVSNIALQLEIDNLEKIVEENKDNQINHLYELYNQVPNYFDQTELTLFTNAQLESIGINESFDDNTDVYIKIDREFIDGTLYGDLQDLFKIVEVQVEFNAMTTEILEQFIDLLYNAEQVFIVNLIDYSSPDGENYITVNISFLAFYELEDAS